MPTASARARLSAGDWVQAALLVIADSGLSSVSVEGLARSLGATKGSFYWHFQDREALLEAALAAWEAGETTEAEEMLRPLTDPHVRLRVLMRAALADRAGARVEAALLSDAHVPAVRAALDRATRVRTDYLRGLFTEMAVEGPAQRATTAFALYVGLLHMRRTGASITPRGRDLRDYVDKVCDWLDGGAGSSRGSRGGSASGRA